VALEKANVLGQLLLQTLCCTTWHCLLFLFGVACGVERPPEGLDRE
jgi:hypothetical protein